MRSIQLQKLYFFGSLSHMFEAAGTLPALKFSFPSSLCGLKPSAHGVLVYLLECFWRVYTPGLILFLQRKAFFWTTIVAI